MINVLIISMCICLLILINYHYDYQWTTQEIKRLEKQIKSNSEKDFGEV